MVFPRYHKSIRLQGVHCLVRGYARRNHQIEILAQQLRRPRGAHDLRCHHGTLVQNDVILISAVIGLFSAKAAGWFTLIGVPLGCVALFVAYLRIFTRFKRPAPSEEETDHE